MGGTVENQTIDTSADVIATTPVQATVISDGSPAEAKMSAEEFEKRYGAKVKPPSTPEEIKAADEARNAKIEAEKKAKEEADKRDRSILAALQSSIYVIFKQGFKKMLERVELNLDLKKRKRNYSPFAQIFGIITWMDLSFDMFIGAMKEYLNKPEMELYAIARFNHTLAKYGYKILKEEKKTNEDNTKDKAVVEDAPGVPPVGAGADTVSDSGQSDSNNGVCDDLAATDSESTGDNSTTDTTASPVGAPDAPACP